MELNVKQFPANITSEITHVEENMWIVNNLGLGVHQCICTAPGGSFDPPIPIYPLNYDFMNPETHDSRFIGRENLFIEFIEKTMEVDHWTQGPHHIWIDTSTRRIVRMWQPWNGLEVWDPEEWEFSVEEGVIITPPDDCMPSWHRWTIKCGDDGYPGGDASSYFNDFM